MNEKQIIWSLFVWFLVTAVVMLVAKKYRSERSSFIAGAIFLVATVFGIFAIYGFFGDALLCQARSCLADKVMVDVSIQFILITWGALGGSLLAKAIENR